MLASRHTGVSVQTIDFPLPLLIGGIIGGTLGAAATAIFHLSIMPTVNQKLPEKERIPLYATDWNLFLILRKHKEIYPLSKVRDVMYALFIGASATRKRPRVVFEGDRGLRG